MGLMSFIQKYIALFLKEFSSKLNYLSSAIEKLNLLNIDEKNILKRNSLFKNKHKGKRAFVIVNGPSLKQHDLSNLKDEITFVVSGFWKHPIVSDTWQPSYYSILDKRFFNGSTASLNFFDELNNKITRSIFFFPLYRAYKAQQKFKLIRNKEVYYLSCEGGLKNSLEFTSNIQSFAGVSAFSLAQAIYMGCSPIYLLGFDHDYLAHRHRGFDKHFYESATIVGDGELKKLGEMIPYYREMKNNLNLWNNYRALNIIAKKKGVKIYNVGEESFLDVFEKIEFQSIY